MVAKVIAFTNQKGGVGKTTSCVNLAACFVFLTKKVLLIDLDPQGNATMGSGVEKTKIPLGSNEVLLGEADILSAITQRTTGNYAIMPANSDLTTAEVGLLRKEGQESNLKKVLSKVIDQFDFILIDCPPSLNMLTLNALVAANSVIIPMQCEYYALEGLSALLTTIDEIKLFLNPTLTIEGIVRTMYDPRNRLSTEVSAQLISHFENKVYQTVIPRNVRVAEAPSHGLPVLIYDKASKGSESYLALAQEILKEIEQQKMNNQEMELKKKSESLKKAEHQEKVATEAAN